MRRDERGSALLAALGVLSALTLLAAMSLLAGGADLVLSQRLVRERSAFYAAESALETTLEKLASGDDPIPVSSFLAPWPAPGIAVRRWRDGEWSCARRICLIPDVGDADADPDTRVVLFDRGFGHAASPLLRGGFPLLQVLVTAQCGESRQSIVAEVAPVTCAPVVGAAWAAAGPLDLTGDIRVEGAAALPALCGGNPVRLFAGAVIDGAAAPLPPQPTDVLRMLNPGGTLPRLEDLPGPPAGGNPDGLFWSRGDYSGPLEGRGILIVHNPAFDPAKHEASRIALEEGVLADDYDPGYSHLDPSRQPARLEVVSGGSFSGVIIADLIGSATDRFTLTGALVTLTRAPLALTTSAPLRIIGSRTAIERSGRGALRHRVGFRPVTVAAERLDACP